MDSSLHPARPRVTNVPQLGATSVAIFSQSIQDPATCGRAPSRTRSQPSVATCLLAMVSNKALVAEAQKKAFFSGCQSGDARRIYLQYMAMGDPAGAMMFAPPS